MVLQILGVEDPTAGRLDDGEVGIGADADRLLPWIEAEDAGRRGREQVDELPEPDVPAVQRFSADDRQHRLESVAGAGSCVQTSASGSFGSGAWSEPIVCTCPRRSSRQSSSTEARSRLGGFHFRRESPAISSSVRQR